MCTVTFLPLSSGGFLFTSNRDEKKSRGDVVSPEVHNVDGQELIFPKDAKSGGSWIAINNKNEFACLLNGGLQYHKHDPPYTRSRGLVLLDSFKFEKAESILFKYDFEGIEPFTLILKREEDIFEIIWDGDFPSLRLVDPTTPRIWSSYTLYNDEMQSIRKKWFDDYLQKGEFSIDSITDFHENGGQDSSIKFNMQRGDDLQTLSITCLDYSIDTPTMSYYDLITQNQTKIQF